MHQLSLDENISRPTCIEYQFGIHVTCASFHSNIIYTCTCMYTFNVHIATAFFAVLEVVVVVVGGVL